MPDKALVEPGPASSEGEYLFCVPAIQVQFSVRPRIFLPNGGMSFGLVTNKRCNINFSKKILSFFYICKLSTHKIQSRSYTLPSEWKGKRSPNKLVPLICRWSVCSTRQPYSNNSCNLEDSFGHRPLHRRESTASIPRPR